MRHQLVPPLVLENYAAGCTSGTFEAVCLFVDTSGFTPLTTAMMAHGAEGAESVADALIGVFGPLVASVYAQGGFIAGFAGDAFKAVFPLEAAGAHRRAALAAWEIRQQGAARRQVQTRFGAFDVAVKATLADGEVAWGVWRGGEDSGMEAQGIRGSEGQRAAYFFEGEALARCLEADPYAGAGEVVLTDAVYRRLLRQNTTVEAEAVAGHWRLLAFDARLTEGETAQSAVETGALLASVDFYPADLLDMPVRGEFRQVVTVFVNLQELPDAPVFAEGLLRLLAQYEGFLCRVGRIGERDRGATLLMFWGAPVSHENDLARALGFLLDLQAAHPDVVLRAGVTTGLAYAGFVGSEQREEYTCHGSTVNLAARLMVTAAWGQAWLDEKTAQMAQGQFDLDLAGTHQLKGFAEARPVVRLAGRREAGEATLYRGQMVGRQAELAQLRAALQPLDAGRFAGVVTILGEAGLGKSRLVHELRNSPSTSGHTAWFVCQCDDVLRQSLHPFRYWLRRYFKQSGAAGEAENKQSFEQVLHNLMTATPDGALAAELERTRSVLGALVDLHWEGSLYEQLEPQGRFENTLSALKALIKAESVRRPVVLHVEDAHWLDADSRQFLGRLARGVAGYPFVVLLTARPELDLPAFDADVTQHAVDLLALSAVHLDQLAGGLLGLPAAPTLVGLLQERSEGNPFFAEQILLFLEERGLLAAAPDGLAPAGAADALPLDVRTVLVARIDRLAAQVRRVVQTAAVLGREFELQVLAEMLRDEPFLHQRVHDAEGAAIWAALSELRYLFRHALLRDAAYQMQLLATRRGLHRLAGEAIEALHGADLAPLYGQLAYHFEQAEAPDKAQRYLRLAGDRAKDQYQNSAAIDFYGRLLGLLHAESGGAPAAPQVAAILGAAVKRADVLLIVGRWDESEAELRGAMEFAAAHGAPVEQAKAQGLLGFLHLHRGEFDLAQQHQTQAVADFRSAGLDDHLSQALNRLGTVLWRKGDGDGAMACFAEALALDRSRGDAHGTAVSLTHLATIYMFRNQFDQALANLQEAFRLYETLGRIAVIGTLQTNLGLVYERMGEDRLALESYRRSLALGRELGYKMGITRCLGNMGNLLRKLGRWDESEACLLEAVQIDAEYGNETDAAWHFANLAELAHARGDPVQAVAYFERALPILRTKGAKKMFVETRALHGEALLALQRLPEAWAAQQEALRWAEQIDYDDGRFLARVLGAKLDAAEGRPAKAAASLQALLEMFDGDAERAAVHYELWRMGLGAEHGQAALEAYSHLAARTANVVYRDRLAELSRASL